PFDNQVGFVVAAHVAKCAAYIEVIANLGDGKHVVIYAAAHSGPGAAVPHRNAAQVGIAASGKVGEGATRIDGCPGNGDGFDRVVQWVCAQGCPGTAVQFGDEI